MKRAGIMFLQLIVTTAGIWYVFHDPQRRAQIAGGLRHADFRWVFLGWICYSFVELLATARWQILLRIQGIRIRWLRAGAIAFGKDAHVAVTIFFENRDPAGPYRFTVSHRRTKHLRFNNFEDPEKIPRDTPYSSLIESDVPIVVQHTGWIRVKRRMRCLRPSHFHCD
jgi:hypothetical protein